MSWVIEYYEEADASCPVKEFVDSLALKHQAKLFQRIQLLEELGPHLEYPYSSQVEGKLRELRAQYAKAEYRVLYYRDTYDAFVLLHVLRKKTNKLPEQDKQLALKRMKVDMTIKVKERRR